MEERRDKRDEVITNESLFLSREKVMQTQKQQEHQREKRGRETRKAKERQPLPPCDSRIMKTRTLSLLLFFLLLIASLLFDEEGTDERER